MKKKLIWIIPLAILLVAAAFLFSKDGRNEKKDMEPDDKIQIGMSFDSFVIERWQRDRDVFVSTAKQLGAEVNVQNANGSIEEQKKHIDYFIDKEGNGCRNHCGCL